MNIIDKYTSWVDSIIDNMCTAEYNALFTSLLLSLSMNLLFIIISLV